MLQNSITFEGYVRTVEYAHFKLACKYGTVLQKIQFECSRFCMLNLCNLGLSKQ